MSNKIFKISLSVLVIFIIQLNANAQLADKIPLTAENQLIGQRTQYILKSDILQEERPIIVSLPIGYNNEGN